ncbi:male-enhanced antigen 1 [Drosophila montana]|uniref:male-enhanced antigen 1 n=1 Tax=Drosophila montana TaxID=40370 RepID=UPI00313C00A0
MGSPELPTDPGEEHDFQAPAIEHPHVGEQSDDSAESDAYDGYQPLATDAEEAGAVINDIATAAESNGREEADEDIDLMTAEVTHGDPNMPPIESIDAEIERQVWNEPRPQELQMELDKARTEQILKAMSKITLPNVTVPDWAKGVPEERWKHELLERIQTRRAAPAAEGAAEQLAKPSVD